MKEILYVLTGFVIGWLTRARGPRIWFKLRGGRDDQPRGRF